MEDKFEEITQNPQREAGIENTKELRCTKDRVRRSITHLIKVIEGEKKNGEEANGNNTSQFSRTDQI